MNIRVVWMDRGLHAKIGGLVGRAKNLAPAMRRISLDLLRSAHRNFALRGRKNGAVGVWPPLSPVTIQMRRQRNPKPLLDTGRLRNSLTPTSTRNVAIVGTNLPYARKHQQHGNFGGSIVVDEIKRVPAHTRKVSHQKAWLKWTDKVTGKKRSSRTQLIHVRAHTQHWHTRLPARPFLWIHREDRQRAVQRIKDHVLGKPTTGAVA